MHSKFRRTGALACTGAVVFGALAIAAGTQADAQQPPLDQILGQSLQGKDALTKVQSRLAEVAQRNGLPEQKLLDTLASDKTSWLDKDGRLFFREPGLTTTEKAPEASPRWATEAVAAAEGPAFELHSKPGSNRVIYLDFDGHTITGTAWNSSVDPVNVTAYDTDGNAAVFGTAEQDVVHEVWARVAEDYAAFDVDVTTQQPAQDLINRTSSSDQQYGTRVLIDPTTWYQSNCGCGGVAYIGVYDNAGQHDYYQPALVFTKGVGTGAKNLAEAASHEAGHNVGLGHDGTASVGYYEGHGSWAPIMGVGYYRGISQWSKGEYSGANNTEDDYSVIGTHGLALRTDEAGDSTGAAAALAVGATANGFIAAEADTDVYRVDVSAAGNYTATASAGALGGNLDIKLDLLNSAGTVVTSADPASGQSNAGTPTGLGATVTSNLQPGTYYLRIDNVGYGNPLNTGYSTYGSRGAYSLAINPS
ncbi:MAG TPA: M12 family metallo-peptidase [Kribbella sp.]|uniref:pre-peptidase C-terminal domain-containing protein n=1 Tax=Kribbella sp. TaxID=1871183 RepID=UPI002D767024|nr:M12 family metallo-peptidase [Kribbella sp.]HET6299470.1 M12 family metallo-peptidase [Kribbella sp.]